jgi:hypothetical protein
MKLHAVLFALALAGAAPAAAQQPIMKSGPKVLSPDQAQAQQGIILLRDSVVAAKMALAQLQRDYAAAGDRTLEGWAGQIVSSCGAAERTAPVARQLVAAGSFVPAQMERGQRDMLAAIDRTRATLAECRDTFSPLAQPGKGEQIRGYGNATAKPLIKKLDKFDQAVHNAVRALELDIREVTKAGKGPV